jgi:hypothetical protein
LSQLTRRLLDSKRNWDKLTVALTGASRHLSRSVVAGEGAFPAGFYFINSFTLSIIAAAQTS